MCGTISVRVRSEKEIKKKRAIKKDRKKESEKVKIGKENRPRVGEEVHPSW